MRALVASLLCALSTAVSGQTPLSSLLSGDTLPGWSVGRLAITDSLRLSGKLNATGSIGYATGAGGTVTQLTSKSTGVTINKLTGVITMNAAALAAAAEASFVVTNSFVAATDVPFVVIASGGTAGSYSIDVSAVAAGSFTITISNVSTGSLSQALVINFIIFKGAAS